MSGWVSGIKYQFCVIISQEVNIYFISIILGSNAYTTTTKNIFAVTDILLKWFPTYKYISKSEKVVKAHPLSSPHLEATSSS